MPNVVFGNAPRDSYGVFGGAYAPNFNKNYEEILTRRKNAETAANKALQAMEAMGGIPGGKATIKNGVLQKNDILQNALKATTDDKSRDAKTGMRVDILKSSMDKMNENASMYLGQDQRNQWLNDKQQELAKQSIGTKSFGSGTLDKLGKDQIGSTSKSGGGGQSRSLNLGSSTSITGAQDDYVTQGENQTRVDDTFKQDDRSARLNALWNQAAAAATGSEWEESEDLNLMASKNRAETLRRANELDTQVNAAKLTQGGAGAISGNVQVSYSGSDNRNQTENKTYGGDQDPFRKLKKIEIEGKEGTKTTKQSLWINDVGKVVINAKGDPGVVNIDSSNSSIMRKLATDGEKKDENGEPILKIFKSRDDLINHTGKYLQETGVVHTNHIVSAKDNSNREEIVNKMINLAGKDQDLINQINNMYPRGENKQLKYTMNIAPLLDVDNLPSSVKNDEEKMLTALKNHLKNPMTYYDQNGDPWSLKINSGGKSSGWNWVPWVDKTNPELTIEGMTGLGVNENIIRALSETTIIR